MSNLPPHPRSLGLLNAQVLSATSRTGGLSTEYSTVSDRIGAAYTPSASGLHKAKAAALAAALGFGGQTPHSSRELARKASSQKLFSVTENRRSQESRRVALEQGDSSHDLRISATTVTTGELDTTQRG